MKRDWSYLALQCTAVALVAVIAWGWYYWIGVHSVDQATIKKLTADNKKAWHYGDSTAMQNDSLMAANDSLRIVAIWAAHGWTKDPFNTVGGDIGHFNRDTSGTAALVKSVSDTTKKH